MRPPLGTSDLKQNEVNRQNYNKNNQQQQHQLSQQYPPKITLKIDDKLHEGQLQDQYQNQIKIEKHKKLHIHGNKLKKREIIVENQLNFACSAISAFDSTISHNHNQPIPPPPPQPPLSPPPLLSNHINVNQEANYIKNNIEFDDKKSITTNSISFVDLSHTTIQPNVVTSSAQRSEIFNYLITPKASVQSTVTVAATTATSVAAKSTLTQIEKEKRKSLDLAYTSSSLNSSSSDENVSNVAANFIIKYPADVPTIHTLNVNFSDNNNINAVPSSVSEHEPLLANYSPQNTSTIPLKNSKCDIAKTHKISSSSDIEKSSINNNNYNSRCTSDRFHKPSRHLSTLYQQQRRSLQFIYNTNSTINDTEDKHRGDKTTLLPTAQHSKSQEQFLLSTASIPCNTTAAATRKQHAYSWYAPVYSALEEEFDQSSRDSSPIHNLANTKKIQTTNHQIINQQRYAADTATTAVDKETVALLESRNLINRPREEVAWSANTLKHPPKTLLLKAPENSDDGELGLNAIVDNNQHQQQQQQQQQQPHTENLRKSTEFKYDIESSHASSIGLTGGPLPRRRRFENFIKSLVGLKGSGRAHTNNTPSASTETNTEFTLIPQSKPASPEITITRSPSFTMPDYYENTFDRMRNGEQLAILQPEITTASTSSLNVVQQKLRHMLRREGSAASLRQERSQSIVQYKGLRKCETVLALTRQPHAIYAPIIRNSRSNGVINAKGVEQIRPLNRLRHSINNMNAMTCTRCSSLISLAASNSRYSLNVNTNAFRNSDISGMVLTRLQNNNNNNTNSNHSKKSNCNLATRMSIKNLQATECTSPTQQSTTAATLNRNSLTITPTTCTVNSINSSCEFDANNSPTNANKSNFKYIPDNKITATLLKTDADCSSKNNVSISNNNNNNNNNSYIKDPLSESVEPKAVISLLTSDDEPDAEKRSKTPLQKFEVFTCKLCLIDVETEDEATILLQCNCQFCTECLRAYIDFEISEGAYEISCPDAQCPTQGRITLPEIAFLTTPNLMKKHHRYRLNREIELDKTRTWCPRAGCETVCLVRSTSNAGGMAVSPSTSNTGGSNMPNEQKISQVFVAVLCPSCNDEFCAACKKTWHPNISCEENSRRLVADGHDDIGIPFDNDMIKCCPMCAVPIEKDEGCAQMMCKRCKHVFCWYCLASLDDDFLLRHYDKGPCKNKLGHSRASVVWHRAQVIGIFAGFGILLLVASPLLLLAAPCIICCKCRSCSGSKIDEGDAELDEGSVLQR